MRLQAVNYATNATLAIWDSCRQRHRCIFVHFHLAHMSRLSTPWQHTHGHVVLPGPLLRSALQQATGELRLNGQNYSQKELKCIGGYVMQDDVLNTALVRLACEQCGRNGFRRVKGLGFGASG